MQRSLIVVDDFMNNAARIRAAPLKLEFPEPPPEAYSSFSGRGSGTAPGPGSEQTPRMAG